MKIAYSIINFRHAISRNIEFVKNFIDPFVMSGLRLENAKIRIVKICIK